MACDASATAWSQKVIVLDGCKVSGAPQGAPLTMSELAGGSEAERC